METQKKLEKANPQIGVYTSPEWEDYELLDSGGGVKLERYGPYTFVRPEAEAIWRPALPKKNWDQADAVFQTSKEEHGGHWQTSHEIKDRWMMQYKGLRFWAQTSASRHLGVFPEQANHWDWMGDLIQRAGYPVRVLNLFGYTGLASLAASQAGARVTHVDASKKVIAWARENQILSGLEDQPIRWIIDDAIKYVRREGRRQIQYDALILDPPKFGRGPKGEVWEFYDLLPALLQDCRSLLSSQPLFIIITAYAVKASSMTLHNAVSEMMRSWTGSIQSGEVVLVERSGNRLLSMAVFSRWQANN